MKSTHVYMYIIYANLRCDVIVTFKTGVTNIMLEKQSQFEPLGLNSFQMRSYCDMTWTGPMSVSKPFPESVLKTTKDLVDW